MLTGNTYEIVYENEDYNLIFTIKVTHQYFIKDDDVYEYNWDIVSEVVKESFDHTETYKSFDDLGLSVHEEYDVDLFVLEFLDRKMDEEMKYFEESLADEIWFNNVC